MERIKEGNTHRLLPFLDAIMMMKRTTGMEVVRADPGPTFVRFIRNGKNTGQRAKREIKETNPNTRPTPHEDLTMEST